MATSSNGGSAPARILSPVLPGVDYRTIRRFDADLLNVSVDGGNGGFAVLHRVDYSRVSEQTGDAQWLSAFTTADDGTTARHVEVVPKGSQAAVRVARLVAQAPAGSDVHYRDGNPLNLALDNLEVVPELDAKPTQKATGAPSVAV